MCPIRALLGNTETGAFIDKRPDHTGIGIVDKEIGRPVILDHELLARGGGAALLIHQDLGGAIGAAHFE